MFPFYRFRANEDSESNLSNSIQKFPLTNGIKKTMEEVFCDLQESRSETVKMIIEENPNNSQSNKLSDSSVQRNKSMKMFVLKNTLKH